MSAQGPCRRLYTELWFKVFPDAKVVQSHATHVHTIPSLTSLIVGMQIICPESGPGFDIQCSHT